jgi:hypothetical protein
VSKGLKLLFFEAYHAGRLSRMTSMRLYAFFTRTLHRLYVSPENFYAAYVHPKIFTQLYAHFAQSFYAAN